MQPLPAVTFRTIGGILDFYIFLGPTADSVIEQYTDVIGKPLMPPYWALGFHLCKWGYNNSENLMKVINRNRAAKFPYVSLQSQIHVHVLIHALGFNAAETVPFFKTSIRHSQKT